MGGKWHSVDPLPCVVPISMIPEARTPAAGLLPASLRSDQRRGATVLKIL